MLLTLASSDGSLATFTGFRRGDVGPLAFTLSERPAVLCFTRARLPREGDGLSLCDSDPVESESLESTL